MDAAAGGAFLSLTLTQATTLMEKMVSNQAWNEEHQPRMKERGIHKLKEVDMLSAKMDLLMKRLEGKAPEKKEVMQLFESRMTCEDCENSGHSGSQFPQLEEDVNYINNNNQYRPQQNQGWTQQRTNYPGNYSGNYQGNNSSNNFSPLRDLVQNQGRIIDNLSYKLASNDKMLETISNKMESFSSAIKNQHSFNKILESQISQLASSVPTANPAKILGQTEELEPANLVDIYSVDLCSTKIEECPRWTD
jgi:hypothetical protein